MSATHVLSVYVHACANVCVRAIDKLVVCVVVQAFACVSLCVYEWCVCVCMCVCVRAWVLVCLCVRVHANVILLIGLNRYQLEPFG